MLSIRSEFDLIQAEKQLKKLKEIYATQKELIEAHEEVIKYLREYGREVRNMALFALGLLVDVRNGKEIKRETLDILVPMCIKSIEEECV